MPAGANRAPAPTSLTPTRAVLGTVGTETPLLPTFLAKISVRKELGLKAGTVMLLTTETDGSLRLRTYRDVADNGRGLFAGLAERESLVDELLSERQAEAERDE